MSLKSKREWLEPQDISGSWYNLSVSNAGQVSLTLADCTRNITWSFGDPLASNKRGWKKIQKIKKMVDAVYAHYEEGAKNPNKNRPSVFLD